MGMFDWVTVEVDLPDGFTGALQTKDFDCVLTTIRIGKDGRLYERKAETKFQDPPEGAPPWSFHTEEIRHWWVDLNYHGNFNFYGDEKIDGKLVWHEYKAEFTDGQLMGIEKLPTS